MRVLVIGDSLVMPRLEYNYDETWLSHLVNHYPSIEFIDKSRRSSSARRFRRFQTWSRSFRIL